MQGAFVEHLVDMVAQVEAILLLLVVWLRGQSVRVNPQMRRPQVMAGIPIHIRPRGRNDTCDHSIFLISLLGANSRLPYLISGRSAFVWGCTGAGIAYLYFIALEVMEVV